MSIEESSLNDPIKLVTATVSLIDQDNHDINENDHHNPQILHDNKPNTHTTGETSIQPLRESISESIVNMRNENEESERLVWELLQQEAEEAYRMQMEFLRSNANEIGAEDFEVLQALVNEGGIEQESHENLDESTEEEWDYDSLLELGSLLGGKSYLCV